MKLNYSFFLASTAALIDAAAMKQRQLSLYPIGGGRGPYTANFTTDPSLPKHTIYLPKVIPAGLKLPVVLWGNGGCAPIGTLFGQFAAEVASWGIMVIANGAPTASMTDPPTSAAMLTESIDWVVKNAGTGNYTQIDASRISAAGQSCGGLEAYGVAADPRVSAVGIFNSGQLSPENSTAVGGNITKTIFYFLGGPTDIAYVNGERDYVALPANVSSWKGNNGKGHGNTFNDLNAGDVGTAGSHFFKWLLRGDRVSAEFFTGGGAKAAGWDAVSKNLDAINVTPIGSM